MTKTTTHPGEKIVKEIERTLPPTSKYRNSLRESRLSANSHEK